MLPKVYNIFILMLFYLVKAQQNTEKLGYGSLAIRIGITNFLYLVLRRHIINCHMTIINIVIIKIVDHITKGDNFQYYP